ncbi:Sialin [Fasciola gigantica]|uniref:Sialin n=1 Tax=Fasciola gigantica TaxID=46835 RepID=A0A504YUN5_FASGI|nr:Sialin [Fasciola gigantica]
MILGVFFWGYLFGQIPLGWITQKFTARHVILANLMLLSASTVLLPLAAYAHLYLFCALRVITGFASAAWFPGFYKIWAAWAPPNERGLLVGFSYAGLHIGNAMTLPISGALCRSSLGWSSVFYFYGAFSFIYAILWAGLVYDSPKEHPRISLEEKRYILSQCGDPASKQKQKASPVMDTSSIPIRSILTSVPVWAFVAINVGFDWNGYTFLTSMPAYMREVLQFDIQENAGLSALPYIGLWIGQISTGWLSDRLIARRQFSVGAVRKMMTSIGTFGPGIILIIMSFFDCRLKYMVVALFTVGLMMSSGVFSGGLLNPIEISPRHAGLIFAGSNSLSAATGFIGPVVVSALTPNKSYREWRYVFYLGATIYAVSGLIFLLFSSSKVQSWAVDPHDTWSSGDIQVDVENGKQNSAKHALDEKQETEENEKTGFGGRR